MRFKIKDKYRRYDKDEIILDIQPGLNFLIGPNGSGKTVALDQIHDECISNDIKCIRYENTSDDFIYQYYNSSYNTNSHISKGEMAGFNFIYLFITKLKQQILEAQDTYNKSFVILLDSIGEYLDINRIDDIKTLFYNTVIPDAKSIGVDLYIVISTNNYEFIKDELCFSIKSGTIKKFTSYDEYAKFIKNYWKGSKTNGKE